MDYEKYKDKNVTVRNPIGEFYPEDYCHVIEGRAYERNNENFQIVMQDENEYYILEKYSDLISGKDGEFSGREQICSIVETCLGIIVCSVNPKKAEIDQLEHAAELIKLLSHNKNGAKLGFQLWFNTLLHLAQPNGYIDHTRQETHFLPHHWACLSQELDFINEDNANQLSECCRKVLTNPYRTDIGEEKDRLTKLRIAIQGYDQSYYYNIDA